MTQLLLIFASLTAAPHHAALATWEACTSDTGCHWYAMPRAPRRPTGHWHVCSSSPAKTVCVTYPRFQRPRLAPKPIATAVPTYLATRNPTARSGTAYSGHTYRYLTSGYAPGCGATGATASGVWPHPGTAAATLAFGTRGYVPGYGPFVVEDRGGAIGDGRLDLYFGSCGEAMVWGMRSLEVTIYG